LAECIHLRLQSVSQAKICGTSPEWGGGGTHTVGFEHGGIKESRDSCYVVLGIRFVVVVG